eukprot:9136905-Pyramimonas_sp.AAC.1
MGHPARQFLSRNRPAVDLVRHPSPRPGTSVLGSPHPTISRPKPFRRRPGPVSYTHLTLPTILLV